MTNYLSDDLVIILIIFGFLFLVFMVIVCWAMISIVDLSHYFKKFIKFYEEKNYESSHSICDKSGSDRSEQSS